MHDRVNPSDSAKVNLNCRNRPSGHKGNFFWNKPATSGRSDGRSGQFCVKIFTYGYVNLNTSNERTTIVQRSTEEWLARKGLLFYERKKLDHMNATPKYIANQGDVTTRNNGV